MVTLLLAPCSNHEEDRSPLIIPRHIAKSGAKMSKLNIRTAERRKKRAMSMPEEEGMVRRKSSFQPKKFLVAGTGNEQRATVAKTFALIG